MKFRTFVLWEQLKNWRVNKNGCLLIYGFKFKLKTSYILTKLISRLWWQLPLFPDKVLSFIYLLQTSLVLKIHFDLSKIYFFDKKKSYPYSDMPLLTLEAFERLSILRIIQVLWCSQIICKLFNFNSLWKWIINMKMLLLPKCC